MIDSNLGNENQYSLESLGEKIPVLKVIGQELESDDNKLFVKLCNLIDGITKYKEEVFNSSEKRYEAMYRIQMIGQLMEFLCDKKGISKKAPATTLKEINKTTELMNKLSDVQQLSIFIISRNISADCFHKMYKNDYEPFNESPRGKPRGIY